MCDILQINLGERWAAAESISPYGFHLFGQDYRLQVGTTEKGAFRHSYHGFGGICTSIYVYGLLTRHAGKV